MVWKHTTQGNRTEAQIHNQFSEILTREKTEEEVTKPQVLLLSLSLSLSLSLNRLVQSLCNTALVKSPQARSQISPKIQSEHQLSRLKFPCLSSVHRKKDKNPPRKKKKKERFTCTSGAIRASRAGFAPTGASEGAPDDMLLSASLVSFFHDTTVVSPSLRSTKNRCLAGMAYKQKNWKTNLSSLLNCSQSRSTK